MANLAHHHDTASALLARKPLYLSSPPPARIDGRDEHLVLQRANGGPLRFPLARVCRVICNRHLDWSGRALALCLDRGVPITWVDGHGRALGHSQSRYAQALSLSTLIETYLEIPDWEHRFCNWRARRRLETLTTCAKRAAEHGRAFDAVQFAELKRDYVYNGNHHQSFPAAGEGMCHALTVDRLHREGLQTCYWGFGGSRFELAKEFAALLWAELNLDGGTIASSARQGTTVAHLFETWARRREARLLLHLGDLKRHLARELNAWQ